MRLLSWSLLWLLSVVLSVTCLADLSSDPDRDHVDLLERRQSGRESRPSAVTSAPAAAKTTTKEPKDSDEGEEEEETTRRVTSTAKPSKPAKTSEAAKTSAAAKSTSAAPPTKTSDKTTPKPSPSKSTEDATTLTTSKPSSSTPTLPSLASTPSTSSTSADAPQPTSILQSQPQSSKKVSVGGIAAGVVLGAAALIGIVWIALAKWRENKRRRNQFSDAEAKRGFTDAGTDDLYPSSQDSLLAGAGAGVRRGKQSGHVKQKNGLRMQALSPLSRAQSFVSSYPDRDRRGVHAIPQDVLSSSSSPSPPQPPLSPTAQYKNLPQLPRQAGPQFSNPLGSHPQVAEMPSPSPYDGGGGSGAGGALHPAGLQAGRAVPRKPIAQVNAYGSSAGGMRGPPPYIQQGPAAELPG